MAPNMAGPVASLRPYRRGIAVLSLVVASSALLGLVGPFLVQAIVDRGLLAPGGVNLRQLLLLVGIAGAATVTGALAGMWQNRLAERLGNRIADRFRTELFAHLHRLPYATISRLQLADLQSRLSSDVAVVRVGLTDQLPTAIFAAFTVLGSLSAMLLLSWQLTVIAILIIPLFASLQRRAGRLSGRAAQQAQTGLSDLANRVGRTLSPGGLALTRMNNRTTVEITEYAAGSRIQADHQVAQALAGQRLFTSLQALIGLTPVLSYLAAGFVDRYTDSSITLGTVVAFSAIQLRVLFPAVQLLQVATALEASVAGLRRVREYFGLGASPAELNPVPHERKSFAGHVTFDNVFFTYDGEGSATDGEAASARTASGSPDLANVSWEAPPGSVVGIVGPSGAGKSTLTSLLTRLYDPQSGSVQLDGCDIRRLNVHALRSAIALVPQQPYFFDGTVRENLRYANERADDPTMWMALERAGLSATLGGHREGLDTVIGEQGLRLSGGERQRLAIARALLQDAPILVLDEATSALDGLTERSIMSLVLANERRRTVIIIAHRLSTIRGADSIVVLDSGRVVETGRHAELMANGALYASLHAAQDEGARIDLNGMT